MAIKFTPEELAEMAAFDAEVDADDTITPEEWDSSMLRDLKAGAKLWNTETRKAYYLAHKEQFKRNTKNSDMNLAKRYGRFGAMIREERKRLGKTGVEMAKLYHTSTSTWYKIERGQCIIRWDEIRSILPGIGPKPSDFPLETR